MSSGRRPEVETATTCPSIPRAGASSPCGGGCHVGGARRHSAVWECTPVSWSRRNTRGRRVPLVLTVLRLKICLSEPIPPHPHLPKAQTENKVCDAFPDPSANSTSATSL